MTNQAWRHPGFPRRTALQAGAIGLLGLGQNHLSALRAEAETKPAQHRAAIYIFLSGGLAQHDSFDLKPDAPDNIRGEFRPIATSTPGIEICEHLPHAGAAQSTLVAGPVADASDERPFAGPSHHADRPRPACRRRSTPTSRQPTDWPGDRVDGRRVHAAAQ